MRRHASTSTIVDSAQRSEAEIRQRIDELVEAIRAMDLDRVMSIYAPNSEIHDTSSRNRFNSLPL